MAGMGIGNAFGAEGAAEALRQLIKDRLEQQQQQFTNNRLTANDQRVAEEHQAAMQSLQEERASRAEQAKQSILTSITGRLTPGQTLNAADSAPLPNYLKSPEPMQAPAAPDALAEGPQGGAMPGTIANSVTPQARQDIYTGTDKQKTDEEQKTMRGRLMMDPSLSPRERLMIGMENAGLKVPANMEAKPGPRGELKDTPQGLVRVGDDNGITPVLNNGKPVQVYHAPQQPIVVQTGNGPQLLNRGQGTTTPIKEGGSGNTVTAPLTATEKQEVRTKKDAQDTLTQLDQAIENAKDLIGPGAGRVSSIEQMIGNPDPRINALGVKMKAAKMRADHAITGSVRAGASPVLLKQWDDILANKVTPEALHSGVQALREIIGGDVSTQGGKPTAEELIKKYGGD